jgi:hypothetical protein
VKTSGEQTKVSGPTILNGGQETRQSVQRASFTMRGGKSGAWKGICIRTVRKISQYETSFVRGERVIRTEVEPLVKEDVRTERCDLRNLEISNAKVTLELGENEVNSGSVESRLGAWQLWSSTEQREQPFGPARAGIVFRDASGAVVAALDTGGRKRIAFRRELETTERALIAAVSVTILLLQFL